MKVLFCQRITYPFVGIMSISAVCKNNGHETKLKIFNIAKPKKQDLDEIKEFRPDILAFPTYTGWQKSIINFCKWFKKNNKHVITQVD